MKNVVECPREFIAYFNALETTCDIPVLTLTFSRVNCSMKNLTKVMEIKSAL